MAIRSVEAFSTAAFVHYRSVLKIQRSYVHPAGLTGHCTQLYCTPHTEAYVCDTGYGVIVPVTPTLMTDFFASRHSDVYIHCEDYTSQKAPPSCRDAHSDAVNWSSASSFISNSVLSFALVRLALPYLSEKPSHCQHGIHVCSHSKHEQHSTSACDMHVSCINMCMPCMLCAVLLSKLVCHTCMQAACLLQHVRIVITHLHLLHRFTRP